MAIAMKRYRNAPFGPRANLSCKIHCERHPEAKSIILASLLRSRFASSRSFSKPSSAFRETKPSHVPSVRDDASGCRAFYRLAFTTLTLAPFD